MLTPEQKSRMRKLVEALRSGKYKQTAGRLKTVYGFCCLGLACELSGLSEWETRASGFAYLKQLGTLDNAVIEYYGFEGDCGFRVPTANGDEHLASLNDSGMTFPEIATLIEQHYGLTEGE